jgi:hypothetical protein
MREKFRAVIIQSKGCSLFLVSLFILFALPGCKTAIERDVTTPVPTNSPPTTAQKLKKLHEIGGKLNQIERYAEEWGRGSVSDIALIDNRASEGSNGFFALNYNQPMSNYVALAQQNTQGFVTESKVVQSSTGVAVQYAPGISIPSPPVPTNSAPITNTAPITTNTAPVTNAAPITTSTVATNTTPAQTKTMPAPTNAPFAQTVTSTVQSNSPPQLSANVVEKIAATDYETAQILNYMSDPINLPENKKAYLGVMQVSLLPGWRTKMGYIAEVQVAFQFAMSKSNCLKIIKDNKIVLPPAYSNLPNFVASDVRTAELLQLPSNRGPSIISAFPFAEAQILDLNSSYQRQLSFLAQLAGSVPQVPGLAASLSTAFNKLTPQNIGTRTALPLVVPSSQGSDVTYRFDPELQALINPASPNSAAGQVLEPSSFPALVVIICDEPDLLVWDSLSVAVETRWIPAARRNWFKKYSFDWWYYGSGRHPQDVLSNKRRLENAYGFDELNEDFSTLLSSNFNIGHYDYAYQELTRRFDNLKTAAMGHTLYSAFPLARPQITGVYPAQFRRDYLPQKIHIQGHFFNSVFATNQFVGLQGMPFTNQLDIPTNGQLITATLTRDQMAQLVPGQYEIEVATEAGKTTRTNCITVLPTPAPVINSVVTRPLREYPPEAKGTQPQQVVYITGQNFVVGDNSLKVAIGNVIIDEPTLAVTNESISIDLGKSIEKTNGLNLPPGNYDLTVITSGGQTTQSAAVQIVYHTQSDDDTNLPPLPPVLTGIYPDKIRLDYPPGTNVITVLGDFFSTPSMAIKYVALGPIPLRVSETTTNPGGHSLTIRLPTNQLAVGSYDLEVVNQAGRTVLSNALQILPVPAPAITNLMPMPLQISSDAGKSNQTAVAQQLAVLGTNFQVGDESLKISIGGTPATDLDSNRAVVTNFSVALINNNLLLVTVNTNLAAALKKDGKYDLTILTSGGYAVQSNAIVRSSTPASNQLSITAVYPTRGSLYSTSTFGLIATNAGTNGGWQSSATRVANVLVGGRNCEFKVVSSNELVFTVPPWAKVVSTNDTVMATNKQDLVVITTAGVALMTNAIAFDLTLPNDFQPYALTPEEQKISKLLDAIFYSARVLGTNPVLETDLKFSASAGTNKDKLNGHASVILPGVSASIHVGTNAAIEPGPLASPQPVPKTNSAASQP